MPETLAQTLEQSQLHISPYSVVATMHGQRLEALSLWTRNGPQLFSSDQKFINNKAFLTTSYIDTNRRSQSVQDQNSREYSELVEAESVLSELVLKEVAQEMFGGEFVVRNTPSSLDVSVCLKDARTREVSPTRSGIRSEGGDVIVLRKVIKEGQERLDPYLILDAKLGIPVLPAFAFNVDANVASLPVSIKDFRWIHFGNGRNIGFTGYLDYMRKMIKYERYKALWKQYPDIRNQWMEETAKQIKEGLDYCQKSLRIQQESYGKVDGDDEIEAKFQYVQQVIGEYINTTEN